jgi:hypothetical protein
MRIDSGDSESISGRHAKQRRRQERLEGRIRKCVAGCGISQLHNPSNSPDFNVNTPVPIQRCTYSEHFQNPKSHDLTFLSYRSSIKPPLLPLSNQSLASFHHPGTASPCMSSPHLFPQPPSISQTPSQDPFTPQPLKTLNLLSKHCDE